MQRGRRETPRPRCASRADQLARRSAGRPLRRAGPALLLAVTLRVLARAEELGEEPLIDLELNHSDQGRGRSHGGNGGATRLRWDSHRRRTWAVRGRFRLASAGCWWSCTCSCCCTRSAVWGLSCREPAGWHGWSGAGRIYGCVEPGRCYQAIPWSSPWLLDAPHIVPCARSNRMALIGPEVRASSSSV